MMNTAARVWDGNKTFLMLDGTGLYSAFLVVYSTLLCPVGCIPFACSASATAWPFRHQVTCSSTSAQS